MKISSVAVAGSLAILAGCCAFSDKECQENQKLRVMSYNVHHGAGLDDVVDHQRIADVIVKAAPDAVCMQEVDFNNSRSHTVDMTKVIGKATEMPAAMFAPALHYDNGSKYGVAILNKESAELVKVFNLPVAEGREPRVAALYKIAAGEPYYFVATHFPWEEDQEDVRLAAVDIVTSYVKENNLTPVILVGDLNVLPDSKTLNSFRDHKWMIANDINLTNTFPADKPDQTIDFIMFYPQDAFTVTDCFVMDEPLASDHRPVVADLVRN